MFHIHFVRKCRNKLRVMRENKTEGRKRESETEVTSCINDEERKMLRAIIREERTKAEILVAEQVFQIRIKTDRQREKK